MNPRTRALTLGLVASGLMLSASAAEKPSPVPLAPQVDLQKFSGDWYVIGIIPNFIEKKAYNSVESYTLDADGTIDTTFRYRKGGFDGPLKTMTPRGFVQPNTGNALWGMQVFWPIRGEYRIAHVEPDYSATIIGRSKLDYVWLLSRNWQMGDADFEKYRAQIGSWGYDASQFVRVPHQWPEASPRP